MGKILTAVAAVLFSAAMFADVKVDPVFSSNMVLQQQKPIAFFGTADKNATVAVEFNGKTVSVKTGADGKWRAEFPAMNADSINRIVKITDGKKEIVLKDVLIGEVWFCSGQSNMRMRLQKKFWYGWSAQNCEQEVAEPNYPGIRYAPQIPFRSHNQLACARYERVKGWVKCDPSNAHFFSATAYFFGRKLHQDLKVPVGLIVSSLGGTRIEPWISLEGYENAGLKGELKTIEKFRIDAEGKTRFEATENRRFMNEMAAWHPLFVQAGARAKVAAQGWSAVDFDDSLWQPAKVQPSRNYVVRWYRNCFMLPESMKGKTILFAMKKCGEKADIYLNGRRIAGWEADAPESEKTVHVQLSAEAWNQNGRNVLAVRSEYFYLAKSGGQMRNIISHANLFFGKAVLPLKKSWKMMDEFVCTAKETAGKTVPKFIDIPYKSDQFPSILYNGMVDAWTKLPIRGVIWYQGCSNSNGDPHYYVLHKALIADWRAKWNNPEMPFIIVQLAGYQPGYAEKWRTANPNASWRAFTRDIQLQMLNIPNVGLATAIDIGEVDNVHPANKQDVGKRLALEAERMVYGRDVVSRGPLFVSAMPENGAMRVKFKYAEGLKTSDGGAPGAFALAGADRKFFWADARIEGNEVVVSSPEVPDPKYVRYAYAGYRGDCNLQNGAGLPAYPFRSDAYDYSKAE